MNGNTSRPPSMCANPANIARRLMRSYVFMPSIDMMVARPSTSLNACRAWATHSQPARIDNAYWNGAVADTTALLNCCEIFSFFLTQCAWVERELSNHTPRRKNAFRRELHGHDATKPTPHGTMASDHQHRHLISNRAVSWQMHVLLHTPKSPTNAFAMLAPPCSVG